MVVFKYFYLSQINSFKAHILRYNQSLLCLFLLKQYSFLYISPQRRENTSAYLNAMTHPCVKVLGHCDNPAFPVDYETLAVGAKENGVIFEINEASLAPYGYRGDTRANNQEILKYCMKYEIPIVLSSDSHGGGHIGDFTCAAEFVHEMMFPEKMILNNDIPRLKMILSER